MIRENTSTNNQKSIDYMVEKSFFPVEARRLFWEDEVFFSNEDNHILCKDWVAIVDMEMKHVFTTATRHNYVLYTNRRTYHFGETIAKELWKLESIDDIVCATFALGKNRASVEYNLCDRMYINQPHLINGWMPVITMQNSYNKTKPLACILGFRNINRGFNVLFPQFSAKAKSAHDESAVKMELDILEQLKSKRIIMDSFVNYFLGIIKDLQNTPIALTDFLPLFCKIQRIKKSKNLPEMQKAHLINSLKFVNERISRYSSDYGNNGYAMLMVVADYIENLNPEKRKLVATEQMALGAWVEEFIEVSRQEDYSPYTYIGKEAYDAASWFGTISIVSNKNK